MDCLDGEPSTFTDSEIALGVRRLEEELFGL
jgi:hypothetical protein